MRRQFSRATNAMSIFDRDSIFLFLFFMFCNFLAFVVFTHTRASPMNCGWWWERTKLFPCPDTLPCGKPWRWTNVRTKPIGVSIVALLRVLASLTKSPVDFTFLWTVGQSLTHPVSVYLSKATKKACNWPFFPFMQLVRVRRRSSSFQLTIVWFCQLRPWIFSPSGFLLLQQAWQPSSPPIVGQLPPPFWPFGWAKGKYCALTLMLQLLSKKSDEEAAGPLQAIYC